MNLNSKYFDCIRVKPDQDRLLQEESPECEWEGCHRPAQHPAPKGRGREGQYFSFCLEHVREYNKSYNYFNGMSDEEVAHYQKASMTGHRPTWSINGNGRHRPEPGDGRPNGFTHDFAFDDPFGFLGAATAGEGPREYKPSRPVRNAERKCLTALGLDIDATADEIKARYKDLVKRHHPDSNGGNRRSEDKLREVIQAYNYLKQAGLC